MTENKDIFETTILTLNATLKGGGKESDEAVFVFEKVNGGKPEELERITVQVKKEKWCDSATIKSYEVPLVADNETSYGLSYRVESGGKTYHGKQAYRVWPLSLSLTAKKEGGAGIFPGAQFRLKQGGQVEVVTVAEKTGRYVHLFKRKEPFSVTVNFPYELIKWTPGKDKGRALEVEVRRKAYRSAIYNPRAPEGDAPIKHYVNLPPNRSQFHGHRITVEVGPEAGKRPYALAGDIIYVEVVFDANNSDRNYPLPCLEIDGETIKPDGSRTCKGEVTLGDEVGNRTIEIELGCAGGDTCEIKIGVTELCEDDALKIVNWRKLHYQVTRPQGMPPPDLTAFKEAMAAVFVECEIRGERLLGEGQGPAGSWIGAKEVGLSGNPLLVVGAHNSSYFHEQFKFPESATDLHLLFCDLHLESGRDTVDLTVSAGDQVDWPGQGQVPGLAYDVHTVHGDDYLALPTAIHNGRRAVTGARWRSLAEDGEHEGQGGTLPLSHVRIESAGHMETGGRVLVRFPNEASGVLDGGSNIQVSLGLYLAVGPYPGDSGAGHANRMLIAVQNLSGRETDQGICSAVSHLVGHAMKMVCRRGLDVAGIEDPKKVHSRWYGTQRGHTGNHCATGISGADYGNRSKKLTDLGDSATCPMYGGSIASKSAAYCENCKKLILAARLDDFRG